MRKSFLFFIFLFSALTTKTIAQSNLVDGVLWVVGDQAILKSDVEQEKLQAQYNGTPIQGDPNCVIPEELAVNKLFLHQAEIDSIEVSETAVTNQVENQINFYITQIGSKEKVEEYFNKKMPEIREELRTSVRNHQIIQQEQQKLVENITTTPAEIRRFYNSLSKDSIPTVPAEVELQIIKIAPPVPQAEIERVKAELRGFAKRVNSGNADFSVLATLYSEDPVSAKNGGDIGFSGRAELDPAFAAVAFNLTDPKKASRVVKTEFGYHIIQLIEKRGDRIDCRHILLKPRITQADKDKAINEMDSIAKMIRNNKMTFKQAVVYYSQDKNSAMNAGLMYNEKTGSSKFEYKDLPAAVAKIVYKMNVGEISNPFVMTDPKTNREVVEIVKVRSKTENHRANLTDDYQMLKNYYENKKKTDFINNWIAQKQKETYISIDPSCRNCHFKYPGWIKK